MLEQEASIQNRERREIRERKGVLSQRLFVENMTTMIGEGNSKSGSEREGNRKIHLPPGRSPEKMRIERVVLFSGCPERGECNGVGENRAGEFIRK